MWRSAPIARFQFSNPYAEVDVQVKHVEEGVKLNQSVHASDKGCPNLPLLKRGVKTPTEHDRTAAESEVHAALDGEGVGPIEPESWDDRVIIGCVELRVVST